MIPMSAHKTAMLVHEISKPFHGILKPTHKILMELKKFKIPARDFNGSLSFQCRPPDSNAGSQDLNAGSHNSSVVSLESNAGSRDFPLPAFSAWWFQNDVHWRQSTAHSQNIQ
jgi:hypothetical protein